MVETQDNVENKPENVEKSKTEADKASAKGADEAYGNAPKNGVDAFGNENIFGLPKDRKDYTRVGEDTLKTRDGETIKLVDNEEGGDWLYGDTDWETLFSWSTEERNERDKVKAGDDSWLANLGFSNSDDKEKEAPAKAEEPKKSLLDSITAFEFKDVTSFIGGLFGSDSGKKAEAPKDSSKGSIKLDDGSEVAADGSWVKLSAETQKKMEAGGEPIIQKYKDKDGETSLEIKDGKVFHVAGDGTKTEITDKRVTVTGSDGTVTTRDKETGEVRSENTERGIAFEHGSGGFPKKVTIGDVTFEAESPDKVVLRNGDNQTQEFTPETLITQLREKMIRQRTGRHGQAQEAPAAPKESGVYETNSSGIAFRTEDGSTVAVNMEKRLISIRMKEGAEVLIDQKGQVRVREGDGEPVALDRKKLPAGLTQDADGNICLPNGMKIGPDGKVRTRSGDVVDSKTGDVTVNDQTTGQSVTISGNSESGTTTVTDAQGNKTTVNEKTGIATTTTPDDKTVVTWNSRTREFTGGDPSHPDFVFTPTGTKLWDGTQVGPNGEITFDNGTYIDEEGNVRLSDGTLVDADGDVHTTDGKSFNMKSGAAGGHQGPSSIAGYADALASSIAGKSNPNPGDIAALQAALGVLGAMASSLTNAGNLDAYAKVKASEGNVMQALSKAQGNSGQQVAQQQPAQAGAPGRTQQT